MTDNIREILYLVPVILISITFHEYMHGYISYRLGDPTAKDRGRLSLNPLKHLDLVGTIMMFIAKIGWAKPVPIDPSYYKDKKKGIILVSIAGPISNLLLAFIFTLSLVYLNYLFTEKGAIGGIYEISATLSAYFLILNVNLAVFNLFPIPPLDGSKIFSALLSEEMYFKFMKYERNIGFLFLLLIIFSPRIFGFSIIGRAISFVSVPIRNYFIEIAEKIINALV